MLLRSLRRQLQQSRLHIVAVEFGCQRDRTHHNRYSIPVAVGKL